MEELKREKCCVCGKLVGCLEWSSHYQHECKKPKSYFKTVNGSVWFRLREAAATFFEDSVYTFESKYGKQE